MADIKAGAGIITWEITTFTWEDVTMAIIKNGTLAAETLCTTNGKTGIVASIGTWEMIICSWAAATLG